MPGDNLGYGNTLFEDGEHIYLYTTSGYDVLVARTESRDLTSPWKYYVCGDDGEYQWVDNMPNDAEKKRSNILANNSECSMPWVIKDEETGKYYMIGQSKWFGKTGSPQRTASTPSLSRAQTVSMPFRW